MFKTTIAAAVAAVAFAPAAAPAGPYVNVEKQRWLDWRRLHWCYHRYPSGGYEGEVGAASYYVQGTLPSSLLTVQRTALASLVKQVSASPYLMHLASMVNSPSSLLKMSSWMILVLVVSWALSTTSDISSGGATPPFFV